MPVPHKELAPATLKATYEFRRAVGRAAGAQARLASGRQQTAGLGAGVGRPLVLFIGDKGMLLGNGKLLPEEKFKDFQTPPETLPRSPGHWVEWVNYAKGNGPVPGSNFQYSGWTTEANHLGNVAYRTGKEDRVGLPEPARAPTRRKPPRSSSGPSIARAGTTF